MSHFKFNEKVEEAKGSPIRQFKEEISDIEGLIDMTIGQPDFSAPDIVHEAAHRAIDNHYDGYTESRGLLELRQAISEFLDRRYDLSYQTDEILITNGGTGALFSTIFALLNPGDKVLIATPYYPVYKTQIQMARAEIIEADVSESDFILTAEHIRQARTEHGDIKAVLLTYPSNPTGQTYTESQLKELAKELKGSDTFVISDEIYSELAYDFGHVSIAQFLPEQTIVLNGVSKSHAMTGWRSGFIASTPEIINQIFKVNQSATNTVNTIAQYASIAAYSKEGDRYIDMMRDEYKARRDYLIKELASLGITMVRPSGAFYLFIQIPDHYTADDHEFCLQLAKEAKIGVVPGSSFGSAGRGYFRVSYASSMEKLEQFIANFKEFLNVHALV